MTGWGKMGTGVIGDSMHSEFEPPGCDPGANVGDYWLTIFRALGSDRVFS